MCFNVSISKSLEIIEKRFQAQWDHPGPFSPVYHASAFSIPFYPVITNEKKDRIQLYQWGLVPSWVKDAESAKSIRFKTFNARAETIFEKPSFRSSVRKRRCLVLVDGFYEWHEKDKKKYPHYIFLKDNGAFALAGIWDTWTNPATGDKLRTFSVITTEANPLLAEIHNTKKRMPVIIRPEYESFWLGKDLSKEDIQALLKPYDADQMKAHPVSRLITARDTPRNVPEVIKPHKYPELEDIRLL
jgi:putative SOS response-associated peptidase YedK